MCPQSRRVVLHDEAMREEVLRLPRIETSDKALGCPYWFNEADEQRVRDVVEHNITWMPIALIEAIERKAAEHDDRQGKPPPRKVDDGSHPVSIGTF